jgi:uncharacterized protein YhaN
MEDAKAAKLRESMIAAQAFNAAQTAANNEAKIRLFQEDRRNAEVMKTKFKEQMADEAAKEEARRAKVKKLQQFHVAQIEEKKGRIAMVQDETNDEIRDMERQFAVQVPSSSARAAAAGYCTASAYPTTLLSPSLRSPRLPGRGVPGLRSQAGGACPG